jgi:hypothetical protein
MVGASMVCVRPASVRAGLWCLLLVSAATAQTTSIGGGAGLTVTVFANGAYEIAAPSQAWQFSGSIGGPPSNMGVASGFDAAGGAYSEVSFDFCTDVRRHAAIRAYFDSPAVLFTFSLPSGGPNTFSFPTLTVYPKGLRHIAFAGTFAFPTFQGWNSESPWVSFDAAMNTVILSPASHFMVASTGCLPTGELASGISPAIGSLPAGFTQQTLLVIENGINRAFDRWGRLLTGVTGKVRPSNDADVTLSRLGYWTDAGSSYYYTTEPGLTYPQTLTAVQSDFAQHGIALGYLQLDSWFYPKGPTADWASMGGGIYEYLAASPPFDSSLAAFQGSLGIPLISHARWIDPASPYQRQYSMSGTVSIDPLYWAYVANYLASSGAAGFEQDWLADRATTAYNLTDGDDFLDNMAGALGRQNLVIQYCSATARHFLQSTRYNNVTTVRTSQDRFDSTHWTNFLYASRLASAVGIWPFTDVFLSAETDNLLLATLSAGPVGVGDRLGTLSAGNLRRAVRADGTIVKPDVPLTPLDSSFWSDSQAAGAPMIAATYSDYGDLRAWYFFLYAQGANTQAQFRLSDGGLKEPVFLYDYFDGTGRVVQPGELLNEDAQGSRYLVAAPIGPSGIALVGDIGHFVTLGKKRVTSLADDGAVHVSLAFAAGESPRTLLGYSPDPPAVTAGTGAARVLTYDPVTGRFTVEVTAGPDGVASLRIRHRPSHPRFGAEAHSEREEEIPGAGRRGIGPMRED